MRNLKKGLSYRQLLTGVKPNYLLIFFLTSIFLLAAVPFSQGQAVLLGLTSSEGPQGGGTAFTINTTGTNFTLQKGFYSLGSSPFGDLTLGKDGNFYGMTAERGNHGYGTIFKMTPAGKVTILHHLNFQDGTRPTGNLVQGTDGNFYGMTSGGGEHEKGTIFRFSANGILKVLKSFDYTNDGGTPGGSLVQGTDGNFYGMTPWGGKYNNGTIFKITPAGVFTVLNYFDGTTTGGNPYGNLVQGKDGNFYGTTYTGGTYGHGTLFKISLTGRVTILRAFNGTTDGSGPVGSLIQSTDGNFYGTTYAGGENYYGAIFRITPNGAFTVLHHLKYEEGSKPNGSLVRGTDGNFYGMASDGGNNHNGTIFKLTPSGIFTVLKHMESLTTGSNPRGSLVQGNDGNLYGMAVSSGPSRFGTVFKITPSGTFTLLISLPDNNQGNTPYSSLMQGKDGLYYGTTSQGGKYGVGTIFKMCTNGTFTTLHSFNYDTDGAYPESALIQATDGNFYGTAPSGGSNRYGTIYKITPTGKFSVLYSFDFKTNGRHPYGGLVQGNDGNFYGITYKGGTNESGTIYKITPSGTLTTLRQLSFSDGADSKATLVKGKDGNFYGTTHIGGNAGGTIFKIMPTGAFNVLYNFNHVSGGFPRGSLIQDADGNFYGMTQSGGSKGNGTIFKITSSGICNVLYNFDKTTDGIKPNGSLVRDSKGNLYGMNSEGGIYLGGTIFRLTPSGTFTILHHFNKFKDGGAPQGSLILQKPNPAAYAQIVNTPVNTPKPITLSGKGGNPLTYKIVTMPKNGTLTGSGANRTYTPNTNFSGSDSFTFNVTWGCQTSTIKTVSIAIGTTIASTLKLEGDTTKLRLDSTKFSTLEPKVQAKLYPNPASNKVKVDFINPTEIISTVLADATGSEVMKDKHNVLAPNQIELSINQLKAGMYVLHVQTKLKVESFKIIKQ